MRGATHYCDEGENGLDEPDAGSEEEPDVPDYDCLSSLSVHTFMQWTVSRKLREEWAVRTYYTISNETHQQADGEHIAAV